MLRWLHARLSHAFPVFGDTRISLKYSVAQAEENLCAKNELDPFSRFDTIAAYDGHTQTHRRS